MLTFTILGLAGCAMALVALALDWREQWKFESWRDASLEAVAKGVGMPSWTTTHNSETRG